MGRITSTISGFSLHAARENAMQSSQTIRLHICFVMSNLRKNNHKSLEILFGDQKQTTSLFLELILLSK
jgi:hypothetical protein